MEDEFEIAILLDAGGRTITRQQDQIEQLQAEVEHLRAQVTGRSGYVFVSSMQEMSDSLTQQRRHIEQLQAEVERLRAHAKSMIDALNADIDAKAAELTETRANAALVIAAMDAALQFGEALFTWVPAGTALPEGVKTAKGALDQAMSAIRSKQS